jgi:hypothetical protein
MPLYGGIDLHANNSVVVLEAVLKILTPVVSVIGESC